jgi:hypothetical protein
MVGRFRMLAAAVMLTAGLSVIASGAAVGAALPQIGGSWSHLAALPANASVSTITGGADGRLYAFGSCEQNPCPQTGGDVSVDSPVTYRYDLTTGVWQPRRPAPASCAFAEASTLRSDGKILLAGCWQDPVFGPGFRVAIYDTQNNTWTMQPGHGPYVDPIAGMTSANGQIYWFSEILVKEGPGNFVDGHRMVVQRLDGTLVAKAKQPRNGPSDGAGLGSDGRVYTAGGDRDCLFEVCNLPPVEAWQKKHDKWTKPTAMRTTRINVAVTNDANGRIWTIAGVRPDGSGLWSRVEIYRPSTGSWARAADLPDKRYQAIAAFTSDGRVWVVTGYDASGNPLSDGYVFTPN